MSCSNPFYVKGVTDFRGRPVAIPCRTCMCCRNDIMNEWLLRANYEKTHHLSSLFVTFTYNDFWLKLQCYKNGSVNPSLNRTDFQKYIDDIRHLVKKKYPMFSNFSYIGSGEYGDKFKRPHFHLALYGLPYRILNDLVKSWHYGSIDVKPLKQGGQRYVLKYLTKQGLNKKYYNREYISKCVTPPFITYSKGFGSGLYNDHCEEIRTRGMIKIDGKWIPINPYWKSKYFDISLENIFKNEARFNEFKRVSFFGQEKHYKNYTDMRAKQLLAKEERLYQKAVNSLQFVDYFGRRPAKERYHNLTSPPVSYYDTNKQDIYLYLYKNYNGELRKWEV